MSKKVFRSFIIFVAAAVFIFSCKKTTIGLKPENIKPLTYLFLTKHVQFHDFNDEISERTLNNILNYLDPGKYYFYQEDVKGLNKYKDQFDDLVKANNYEFIHEILSLYNKRFNESMNLTNELLKLAYNFNQDESIIIDREKVEYAKDKEEMKERWRLNVKLQLLNRLIIEKDIEKAKEKVKKKYDLLKKRVDEINTEKMISIFINAFSTALDPHSNYLTQEEHEDFMISTKLKLEGIGVLLKSEDGFVAVESIMPNGPADKLPDNLKLKPNDRITAVAQDTDEPVDVIDMDLRDVVKMIRGKKGTVVKLTILREATEKNKRPIMVIPITRDEIKLQDKEAKSELYILKKDKKEIKIGYIKLPTFYLDFDAVKENDPQGKSSSRDMINQINNLTGNAIAGKKIDAMVIDLRGNPGGALTEAVNIAGMFIDKGPVVQILLDDNRVEVMDDTDAGENYEGPIVVLIDKFSASASEIFAGAIKDYNRGIIIGSDSTFGKGSVQSYNELPGNNGAMKVTTALFYQPAGSSNQLNGIAPDINVPELTSAWDMGENKLTNSLKWKKIEKSDFKPYKKYVNPKIMDSLSAKSAQRVKGSKKFSELIQKIKSIKDQLNKKEITLKEEAKIEDQRNKDIERMKKDENQAKLIDLANDILLEEAFNITGDYVEMLGQKAQ